ncbi:MAG TPA: hypothetical protein VF577_08135 [Allosphingosinicella sp.]|jgi:hypothetical protein
MPRYYFNVSCDGSETTDLVGQPCANDVVALNAALRTAGAVVRQRLDGEGFAGDGWVEVEDEAHRSVLRVPLRAAAY